MRILTLVIVASAAPSAFAGGDHPDFLRKLSDPAGYVVDRHLVSESICGSNDLQRINGYDGSLGKPTAFVRQHKFAVGALASSGVPGSSKYCTGTLVGPDLFLTASHCVDASSTNDFVSFSFEHAAGSDTLLPEQHYKIAAIVENGSSIDYAVLRLDGQPGLVYGWTSVRIAEPGVRDQIIIIQHPSGEPKMVEIGTVSRASGNYMYYGDLDTEPGSSGSGILDAQGQLIGVHTNGGCHSTGGDNSGVRLAAARSSTMLPRLAGVTLPFGNDAALRLSVDVSGAARRLVAQAGGVALAADNAAAYDWRLADLGDGAFQLVTASGAYLAGSLATGALRLDDGTGPELERRWRVSKTEAGAYVLALVGEGEGSRWLNAAAGASLGAGAQSWRVVAR